MLTEVAGAGDMVEIDHTNNAFIMSRDTYDSFRKGINDASSITDLIGMISSGSVFELLSVSRRTTIPKIITKVVQPEEKVVKPVSPPAVRLEEKHTRGLSNTVL